jgi:hypothetical protein
MRSQETTTLAATKLALHFAHEEEDMVGSRGDAQPRPAGQCTQLVWWWFLRAGVEVSPVIVNSGDSSDRCDAMRMLELCASFLVARTPRSDGLSFLSFHSLFSLFFSRNAM